MGGGAKTFVPQVYKAMFLKDVFVATGLGLAGGAVWWMYYAGRQKRQADFHVQYNKALKSQVKPRPTTEFNEFKKSHSHQ